MGVEEGVMMYTAIHGTSGERGGVANREAGKHMGASALATKVVVVVVVVVRVWRG